MDGGWPDYGQSATRSGDVVVRELRLAAGKWSRLTVADIAGLGSSDDLVAALVERYGLQPEQAGKIVAGALRAVQR
jgi:hypothetical protein